MFEIMITLYVWLNKLKSDYLTGENMTKKTEVERIVEKYGQGFDSIYFDGKADGIVESKLEIARNFLRDGLNVDIVARNTGLSLNEIKSLKKEL